ncbi:MAG: MiaB/RimO family radical SAM methylthiotransferase [Deltaproteobacteria bacterium]|jgi:threonylcarbamoyladenosine tRNA methylthiotransferase MtaB|nr:MiaB/RimO family radical SAM methylthiotransferase [Deltaproteobacteria bacterium]
MKYRIHTMGCKVNQAESAAMAERLSAAGHVPCGASVPSLVVLNTCCVTATAEKEAFQLLRRVRREHPGAKVVAAGCLAQLAGDRLLEGGLSDLVLGNSWKGLLADMAGSDDLGASAGKAYVDDGPDRGFAEAAPGPVSGRTRAFHKIQDGCSRSCSYCVIPSLRGPSRSLPEDRVLDGLKAIMDGGAAECVLTGIHMGAWGSDLAPRAGLAGLLEAIERGLAPDPGRFRLRLSSLEPGEAVPLLRAFETMPFLAPHVHISMQSAADPVLRLMRRPYTSDMCRRAAEAFAARVEGVSIGADLIAGFPGETEADFLGGLELIRTLPLSYLHVFPFSERPGTRAAALPGAVPPEERRRRARELKRIDREFRERFLRASCGREHLAVSENAFHRASGRRRVLTGNYINALLPEGAEEPGGRLVRVRLGPSGNRWGLPEAEPCA